VSGAIPKEAQGTYATRWYFNPHGGKVPTGLKTKEVEIAAFTISKLLAVEVGNQFPENESIRKSREHCFARFVRNVDERLYSSRSVVRANNSTAP